MFRQEVVLATDRVGPLGSAGHKRCLAVERWLVAGRGDYKQQWLTAVLTVGCGGARNGAGLRTVFATGCVGHVWGWPWAWLGHKRVLAGGGVGPSAVLASTSACRRQC